MDNERPNERTWWSSRLEEPGALPGTGLADKEAAWDKLYDRLKESETPRRRRMIWLWAAAACLLLIVIPAALLLKDGHKSSHRRPEIIPVANTGKEYKTSDDRSSSNPSMAVSPPQPGRKEGVDPGKGIDPTNRQSVDPDKEIAHARPTASANFTPAHQPPGQPAHHMPVAPAHPIKIRPDLNKLLTHNTDTLTLVFARPDLSKPLTVAAAVPPKNATRVVHINELEPPQPTPATATGQRRKPGALHIELTPEEPFRPSTTYTEPAAHPILSLKHTQNP